MLIEAGKRAGFPWWAVPLTLLLALSLVVVPLPEPFAIWRPDWVALAIVAWCLYAPNRVGVVVGWICGLALDIMQFTLLGEQAMSLAIVAYIANRYHTRFLKMAPVQQTACVFALLLFDAVFVAFVQSFVHQSGFVWQTCAPALSAIVLWPIITLAMRNFGRPREIL